MRKKPTWEKKIVAAPTVLYAQLLTWCIQRKKNLDFLEEIVGKVSELTDTKVWRWRVSWLNSEHGNGYKIKIIKFGERNLCKRCYLAWNVYVIILSVQYVCVYSYAHASVISFNEWVRVRVCMCKCVWAIQIIHSTER